MPWKAPTGFQPFGVVWASNRPLDCASVPKRPPPSTVVSYTTVDHQGLGGVTMPLKASFSVFVHGWIGFDFPGPASVNVSNVDPSLFFNVGKSALIGALAGMTTLLSGTVDDGTGVAGCHVGAASDGRGFGSVLTT